MSEFAEIIGGEVLCPACNSEYLHQYEVEVGWRREDQDVERTVSSFSKLTVDKVIAKNVSSPNGYGYRRQYVVIRFECENCEEFSEMEIYQVKGNTRVAWVTKKKIEQR